MYSGTRVAPLGFQNHRTEPRWPDLDLHPPTADSRRWRPTLVPLSSRPRVTRLRGPHPPIFFPHGQYMIRVCTSISRAEGDTCSTQSGADCGSFTLVQSATI
ncbi:hypothetical protein BDY21DRAFT_74992 [Lineolata rhizophorae]|uniref:Uncharacterized protein n=1 Tax=Lineolata rhizophorae TaxID=578093 RepID=A0A6A6NUJ0_9PEZI|nr:hypothetical protein BDY21DRAFT_74992 [Lineolata rhizophorae]